MKINRAAVNTARAKKGLTLETLASAVGVKRDALQRWMAGTRWPSAAHLDALAKALGVKASKLIQED